MISSKPIRVLHVFGCMNREGAQMRTLDVMRRIDPTRFRLDFCVLSGKDGDLAEEIAELGGQIYPCSLKLTFPQKFPRLLRERRYDVVHSHVQNFSGLILTLARRAGVPLRVAHFRSTGSDKPRHLGYTAQTWVMRHLLNGSATHVFGNGEASLAVGWNANWQADSRCAVIHNGLDINWSPAQGAAKEVRSEFDWPDNCPLFIHVGRMVPVKNHLRVASIFCEVIRRLPEARFLFVGGGCRVTSETLQAFCQEHQFGNRVALAGVRQDVPRLLAAADALIFPSLWEGLPGTVLEACAMGTPVVASSLPGIVEIASHFDSVRCLSLNEDDGRWAETALELREAWKTPSARTEAQQRFPASVYNIELCAKAHELAWSGAAGSEIRQLYGSRARHGEPSPC